MKLKHLKNYIRHDNCCIVIPDDEIYYTTKEEVEHAFDFFGNYKVESIMTELELCPKNKDYDHCELRANLIIVIYDPDFRLEDDEE